MSLKHIFETPEVTETILLKVDTRTLLFATAVSRQARSLITRDESKIQGRVLFLAFDRDPTGGYLRAEGLGDDDDYDDLTVVFAGIAAHGAIHPVKCNLLLLAPALTSETSTEHDTLRRTAEQTHYASKKRMKSELCVEYPGVKVR